MLILVSLQGEPVDKMCISSRARSVKTIVNNDNHACHSFLPAPLLASSLINVLSNFKVKPGLGHRQDKTL